MRVSFLMVVVAASAAWGKPWNGISPGTGTRDEVTSKFGPASKVVAAGGFDVLAYLGAKAISGTTQAQFKVDRATGVVQRIDVFPAPTLSLANIEASYGVACKPGGDDSQRPCYELRDEGQRHYLVYQRLGLAIFFKADGTVQSFAFLPGKK